MSAETLQAPNSQCESCELYRSAELKKLGVRVQGGEYVVALCGNPNTGKTTVFNSLTGLRQHTGNWPGKTVSRAEGAFEFRGRRYKAIDLPGAYSLIASGTDEEIARDFIVNGRPDVTVIVVDAARLERNLNLVLQILEISHQTVVCLNLIDEAHNHGIEIDARQLARDLGVPVVATAARFGEGLRELVAAIDEVATGEFVCRPLEAPDGSRKMRPRLKEGAALASDSQERIVEELYARAARITKRCVREFNLESGLTVNQRMDRVVTSRIWGIPIMVLLFAFVFWITITGANIPSRYLSRLFIDVIYPWLRHVALSLHSPWWLTGVCIDGMYLATAWVVSVMLPPMAIFFPLFTLLEDFGYLPRVAFNLDNLFKKAGAHGKQSLSMMMGFGCNAAGVIASRIIDSPRERLIAILTNNFALCNGRWPTQILLATLFIGSLMPTYWAGLVSACAVLGVAVLGVFLTFVASWILSRTILRGEVSTFSLELPPYRPPRLWQTLYRSLIDRTAFVLWRAVKFALPAGAVIWLMTNLRIGPITVAELLVHVLNPVGIAVGLNGIILLAYIVAIPANDIVIPTILMLTVLATGANDLGQGAGVLFEIQSPVALKSLLEAGGWTILTAVNLMLFSLAHNPCSTTLASIHRETGSARWTVIAALLPLAFGLTITFLVAQLWRIGAAHM